MFQLDQAVGEWKRACSGGEAVSEGSALELEVHLRDSMEGLRESGLGEEEAFLVACHRIGKPAQIHEEFSKVHQRRIWLSRIILMVGGYLIISMSLKLIAFSQRAVGMCGMIFGLGDTEKINLFGWFYGEIAQPRSALLSAMVGLIGVGLLIWLLVSFSRGPGHTILKSRPRIERRIFNYFEGAPGSIGKFVVYWTMLYVVLGALQMLLTYVSARYLLPSQIGRYSLFSSLYGYGIQLVTVLALLLATTLLCRRYRSLRGLAD